MATNRRHAALVARLQAQLHTQPRRYRARLAALALCGYAVLLLVLAFGLGLPLAVLARLAATGATPGYAAVYAILVPGVLGVVVLRALWIRFDRPPGHLLQAGEAPALEQEMERLRVAAGAPALEGIVIDGELNAAAASVPRLFGLLGHRHYLVLGLPLLRVLDRDELAAVIAHEFGHFGAGDGRFTGWIYRVRLSWQRVLEALAARGVSGAWLLARFYAWYVPYFNAYSFALARHNEYAADAVAARTTAPETAASALIRLELAGQRLRREFWPRLEARMRAHRQPPPTLQPELAVALRELPCPELPRLLEATAGDIDPDDTHPDLGARLAALGVATPVLRQRSGTDAASAYLEPLLPRLERTLDLQWRERTAPFWSAAFEAAAADRARLEQLERHLAPTPAERLEHARLVEELRPDFDALPLYQAVLVAAPDSAMAHYRAGVLRLRRGDWDAGVDHLRQAMARDAGAIRPILDELAGFARDADTPTPVVAVLESLRGEYAPQALSQVARDGVDQNDALLPHGLDAPALAALAATFDRETRIARAWLARKRLDLAEEPAHYVVLLDWRGSVASEAAALARLAAALPLPGSHSLFTGSDRRRLATQVRAACGAPVYVRTRR